MGQDHSTISPTTPSVPAAADSRPLRQIRQSEERNRKTLHGNPLTKRRGTTMDE